MFILTDSFASLFARHQSPLVHQASEAAAKTSKSTLDRDFGGVQSEARENCGSSREIRWHTEGSRKVNGRIFFRANEVHFAYLKQATTLVYVNAGLAVFEDVPMSVLSVLWLIKVGGTPSPMVLISMMMGAGMVSFEMAFLLRSSSDIH
jgi:hypothetical protein